MEKRREYAEDDVMGCPRCDSLDVDYDEAPYRARCNACGLEFQILTVAVWQEPD